VYATLAAMGLVLAAGLRATTPAGLLLVLPPVVLVLGWTRIANDVKVTHIAAYLRRELAPRFAVLTGQAALGWELAHRADRRRNLRMVCQTVADLVLFTGAPLAALVAYWVTGPWTPPLVVVSVAEAVLVIGLAGVILAYSGVFDQPRRERDQ
jgi:chromate transport protein ChrA